MPDRLRVPRAFARNHRFPSCSSWSSWYSRRLPLSMTGRAAGQLLYLVLRDEACAELQLIRRRHVVDAEDVRARPHVLLGMTMAVDAPLHLQRLLLHHQRHPIDLAVAGRAADALVDMDAVIEVHEIRKVVDARPRDRLPGPEARAHRLEERAVRENLR